MDKTDTAEPVFKTIAIGLGDEWPIEHEPLSGNYLGSIITQVPDSNNPGQDRDTWVHQFAPLSAPEEVWFLWGSYTLDTAFVNDDPERQLIRVGDLVRVTYQGKRGIKGDKQQLRRYKVEVAG